MICCPAWLPRLARRLVTVAAVTVVGVTAAPSHATGPTSPAGPTTPTVGTTPAPAAALDPRLGPLLERFAAMSGLSARFREEKHMALLAVPLVNEGVLYFAPGGRLARHVTAPAPATVLIDGGTLRYADAGGSETLSLTQNPALQLFVDSFLKIFAGEREALLRIYSLSFHVDPEVDGQPARWHLQLRPRVAPLTHIVDRVELVGRDIILESMRVVEVGGDETITSFSQVDPQRRFTAEELAALFRLPSGR